MALQGLSASFLTAAKSAVVFLATNPAGWAILAAAAIGGLVYALTRVDDSAARAAANLKKIKREAAGMANEFGPALEQSVNRWMTSREKMFEGERGEGMSRDQVAARLENRRKISQALARDMAQVRDGMKNTWDSAGGYGGRVMKWFVTAEEEFDQKSVADSLMGQTGGAWDNLLGKYRIDPKDAEEMGLDASQSWAANELALQRYLDEYERLSAKMDGDDLKTPLDRMGESLERNREIAKELAQAWESVNRARESLAEKRFEHQREKDVKQWIEDDPYAATRHIDLHIEIGRNEEQRLSAEIEAMQGKLNKLKAAPTPDWAAINETSAALTGMLRDCEQAMERTSAWERFREQADEAVTHIREKLRELWKDAYKLDLDLWRHEDDKRFTELLKSDWVSASKEVAQAMARVNADWLATGRQVAERMKRADAGDAEAQRQLGGVLESRRNNVDTAAEAGKKSFQGVREAKDAEERRVAKDDFLKLASEDAQGTKSALSG